MPLPTPLTPLTLTLLTLALLYHPTLATPAHPLDPLPPTRQVTIKRIIDGDTLILTTGERVRLLSINAPELARDATPAQPYAEAARTHLARLAQGRPATLQIGRRPRDTYGRTLAHLFLQDGTDLQQSLLRNGLALAIASPPDLDLLSRHAAAEQTARTAALGLWSDPTFTPHPLHPNTPTPIGFNRVTGVVTAVTRSKKHIRLTLNRTLTLLIPHQTWHHHWPRQTPTRWLGSPITARGWIWHHQTEHLMKIRHPFMLETSP